MLLLNSVIFVTTYVPCLGKLCFNFSHFELILANVMLFKRMVWREATYSKLTCEQFVSSLDSSSPSTLYSKRTLGPSKGNVKFPRFVWLA